MTDYYVSNTGSDSASGSELHPWATVAKVNTAALNPADRVRFYAGYIDKVSTLQPFVSGHPGAPISFEKWPLDSSRPVTLRGVFFYSHDWLSFSGLKLVTSEFQGGRDDSQPAHHISVSGCLIDLAASAHTGTDYGLFGHGDNWTVAGNVIQNIPNSGLKPEGSEWTIINNTIQDVGLNQAGVGVNCHGIYGTHRNSQIYNNDILRASDYGLTPRYENNDFRNNRIINCVGGIAFIESSDVAGVTNIVGNTITGTTDGAIFLSEGDQDHPLVESFFWDENFIQITAGDKTNFHSTTGTITDGGRNLIV